MAGWQGPGLMPGDYEVLWWWVLVGSRGGPTRARILKALMERPMNKHQLAKALRLNYKTVEHHLQVLRENGLVETPNPKTYGAVYHLSKLAESRIDVVRRLVEEALGGG